jgi:ribosomal protein L7/L12
MSPQTTASEVPVPSAVELRRLLHKHLVLVSQLRLASKDFGDLSGLPKEHVAAALVVQEASSQLHELHGRLYDWHIRQKDAPQGAAAPVTESASAISPRVSLVLKEYAANRKVNVIRVIREVAPGFSLTAAKALVERELPTYIMHGIAPEVAETMRQKFEAVGAACRIVAGAGPA